MMAPKDTIEKTGQMFGAAMLGELFESNRRGESGGICSVCSAHELVLVAALRLGVRDQTTVLIEATANQVNQFGGYTGYKPQEFVDYVLDLASNAGLATENIVLGGDHLGPTCWMDEPAQSAMEKSAELVKEYVEAGFQKIHLDTSMSCLGDENVLSDEVVAERTAQLCKVAEKASTNLPSRLKPFYVIGTEVPVPGGETEEIGELAVTTPERALSTIAVHKERFENHGLSDAWQRVVALVVQPGVEFNHTDVHHYDRQAASGLSAAIKRVPKMVFEAHSTDYQPEDRYRQLVEDHFAILKVGPQLTFTLREALFALSYIESELFDESRCSLLLQTCEDVMRAEPAHWQRHYAVEEPLGRLYRRYSYSDRIRYYWKHPKIERAAQRLFENLNSVEIPRPLLSQYLPGVYGKLQSKDSVPSAEELVILHIQGALVPYSNACKSGGGGVE